MTILSNNNKTKIVFVTKSDLTGTEGHNIATKEVALALSRHPDVETTVVCPKPVGDYPPDIIESLDNVVHFPRTRLNSIASHWVSSAILFITLQSTLNRVGPDLVIARMSPVFFSAAFLTSWKKIPYVLLARGNSYKTLRFSRVLTKIFEYNVKRAEKIYTASEEIKQDANKVRRPDQSSATVLSNAVDPNLFHPIQKANARNQINIELPNNGLIIGFVGTMEPYHAVEELLQAVASLKRNNIELLIIGDGPMLSSYQSTAENLGINDRVHFPGFVDHDEVYQYISACDLMYGVSHQESATPIKCFEYLACERPILVQDIEDMNFVSEFDVGKQIDPVPDEIARAIMEFADLDKETQIKMGKDGREYIIENHTWDGFVNSILRDTL